MGIKKTPVISQPGSVAGKNRQQIKANSTGVLSTQGSQRYEIGVQETTQSQFTELWIEGH